ncbi:MAG: hypothetical protein ABH890_05910 [Bacillota bacterium]
MIKKVLALIFEPLRSFSNRNFAEKLSVFYHKNKWIAYVLAILLTAIMVFLAYILPNL